MLTCGEEVRCLQIPHHVAQVAVDIGVQVEMAVGIGGLSPIDQIGVEAGLDEVRHHALVGKDVENVRAVDQGEDEQERRLVLGGSLARIVQQFQLIFFVDHLRGRHALGQVLGLRPEAGKARHAAHVRQRFIEKCLLGSQPGVFRVAVTTHGSTIQRYADAPSSLAAVGLSPAVRLSRRWRH